MPLPPALPAPTVILWPLPEPFILSQALMAVATRWDSAPAPSWPSAACRLDPLDAMPSWAAMALASLSTALAMLGSLSKLACSAL